MVGEKLADVVICSDSKEEKSLSYETYVETHAFEESTRKKVPNLACHEVILSQRLYLCNCM